MQCYAGVSGREQPLERVREHQRLIQNGDKTVGSYFLRTNSSTADLTFTPFLSIKSRDPYVAKHLEREFLLRHKFTGDRAINVNI